MDIVAFSVIAFVCIVLPLIVFLVLLKKNKGERGQIFGLFLLGAVLYMLTQWGIKEQGCKWLIENTKFLTRLYDYYFLYVFVISLLGSALLFIPLSVIFRYVFKKKYAYSWCISLGLGYSMCESVLTAGIASIKAIIGIVADGELSDTPYVWELFLSAYERVIVTVIHIGMVAALAYMIQKRKDATGLLLTTIFATLFEFLPDFFLAFSTSAFLEIYSRETALLMIYVILTSAAVTAIAILYNVRYKFVNDNS